MTADPNCAEGILQPANKLERVQGLFPDTLMKKKENSIAFILPCLNTTVYL
jgi:hypothetical protein